MKLHLTYFGDNNFSIGKNRIKIQAENFEVFKSIQEFDDTILENIDYFNIVNQIKDSNQQIPKRGMGYWIWKPYIVLKALENIPNNDVLLYVDCGCELNKNGFEKLSEYYQECFDTEGVFFTLNLPEIQWTKMDTYRHIIGDDDRYLMTRQIMATSFFVKNTPMIKELIQRWIDFGIEKNGHYINDDSSVETNHEIFREHRHDQSIFSLLLKKKSKEHDFTFYEDDTYETIWNAAGMSGVPVGREQAKVWNTYGREYPIWATRNGQIDFTNCEV